jgi:tetratricopeptide (TPR) repeat protein
VNARLTSIAALSLGLCLAAAPAFAADCGDDPAVQAMEKAVKADSKNATNNYNLAVAYYQKQCYEPAIDAFERTAKLLKGDNQGQQDMKADCYGILGALYYQVKQDDDAAIKYFKLALDLKPGDKDSLNGISMACMKAGKQDEAAQYLQQAIAADPRNIEARYRMAVIQNSKLEAAGKKATAAQRASVLAAFEETVKRADPDRDLKPKDQYKDILTASYTRMGELYRDAGETQKAVDVLTRAVKIAPDDFSSRFILGQVYFNLKDYASMIEQYKKAVELDPKQKLARFNLGVAYINQEQFFEAWQQFKAISELDPSDSEALALMGQELENAVNQKLTLGTAKYTAEEYPDAKDAFQAVLTMDPKNGQAKDYLAKVEEQVEKGYAADMKAAKAALKAKKQEDAAEDLEKALALKPDDAEALALKEQTHANISKLVKRALAAGDAAFKAHDYEGAEAAWNRASAFKEGKAKAQLALAKLHKLTNSEVGSQLRKAKAALREKKYVDARNAFKAALAVDRNNADATNGLAQVNTLISDKVKDMLAKGHKAMDGGDKAAAKSKFEGVLKLDINNADANTMITKLTGSESKTKVNADKVKSLYYTGVDQYVNNNIKGAIATWQQLLELDPNNEEAKKNIDRAQAKLKALANL